MVSRLAINTGSFSMQAADMPGMVRAIRGSAFTGIDLRDNHIQGYLKEGHSLVELKKLMEEHGIHPISMNALREWQDLGDEAWEAYRPFVERYIGDSASIGCDHVVCCAYADRSDIGKDVRVFGEICDIAKGHGVSIALEFLPWAELCDIRGAYEIVRRAGRPNGGLLVDAFHFFKGGSKIEDLRHVPVEKIFLVHLCDAPGGPADVKDLCMNGRAFPGEGSFPLDTFLEVLLSEKGYKGWIALEVLNREHQKVDYATIVKKGAAVMEKVLGRYA